MERKKLIAARVARGLSQQEVADATNLSRNTISNLERGTTDPQDECVRALCAFFEKKDPAELDLVPMAIMVLSLEDIITMLERYNRREVIAALQKLSVFAGVDLSLLLERPRAVASEEFLSQCNAAIRACWELSHSGGYATAEQVLREYTPTLSDLATNASAFQEDAAFLAVQAKILQAIHAGGNLDFIGRKSFLREAVQLGEVSGDCRAYTAALYWQADTFVYCYRQPEKALPILNNALSHLNGDALHQQSALFSNLALAYAQQGDERQAMDWAEQARKAVRQYGVPDVFYCGTSYSGLERREGRMFLHLAETIPNGGYAQKAYDAFSQSKAKKPDSIGYLSQTLIHSADAALALGEFHEFVACLEQGAQIAFQVGSLKRQQEARSVLLKAPEQWQKEDDYQKLAKLF